MNRLIVEMSQNPIFSERAVRAKLYFGVIVALREIALPTIEKSVLRAQTRFVTSAKHTENSFRMIYRHHDKR